MIIAPTLFGETALVRNLVRIGIHGQKRLDTFSTLSEAHAAMLRLHAKKDRCGYRRPFAELARLIADGSAFAKTAPSQLSCSLPALELANV